MSTRATRHYALNLSDGSTAPDTPLPIDSQRSFKAYCKLQLVHPDGTERVGPIDDSLKQTLKESRKALYGTLTALCVAYLRTTEEATTIPEPAFQALITSMLHRHDISVIQPAQALELKANDDDMATDPSMLDEPTGTGFEIHIHATDLPEMPSEIIAVFEQFLHRVQSGQVNATLLEGESGV